MAFVDSAHGGLGWKPREMNHREELGILWRKCGAENEWGKLRTVMLCRPGLNLVEVEDVERALWSARPHIIKMREEFSALVFTLSSLGVDVIEMDEESSAIRPNMHFMRDLFAMTPFGAVLSRPASQVRSGEEVIVQRNLASQHVPVVAAIINGGCFEGPDVILAGDGRAVLGIGLRTNRAGAAQVALLLKDAQMDVEIVETTYGCGHLDGVVSLLDAKTAIIVPRRASYFLYDTLRRWGFSVLDIPSIEEVDNQMAINILPIGDGRLIIPARCPQLHRMLAEKGFEIFEIDLSETMKTGGNVHCMTGIIHRDR